MMLLIALWPRWQPLRALMHFVGSSGLDGTILALGTCFVMFAAVLRGNAGSRWTAGIRWFGRHSYEVYMTHEFLMVWGTEFYVRHKHGPLGFWFIGILLLTAPLATLVSHFFSDRSTEVFVVRSLP